ncbi:hypothetical protein ACQ4PT_018968 [Festuca glaucescens]
MELEPGLELDNLVSTPIDAGFPFHSPSSDLPPVQPSQPSTQQGDPVAAIESEPILEVETFISTPSELRQRHRNIARRKSAAAQSWETPDLSSNPTDLELVENYLRPVVQASRFPNGSMKNRLDRWKARTDVANNPAVVNAGLPLVNPSELLEELVLCHVLEAPPDCDAKLKCPTFDQGRCDESHHRRRKYPRNTSFNPIPRESSPMHHGAHRSRGPELNSYLTMFEEVLLGDGDPDPGPDSSIELVSHVDQPRSLENHHKETGHCMATKDVSPLDDHGKSRKRKKTAIVWDYFTKIYALDLEGNVVTLAVCNHCSNVLTGNSKSGTTHLARHTCPCKLKPVQAGRKDKGMVNVLSSQAS